MASATDQKLYLALVGSEDVNVVLLSYEALRKRQSSGVRCAAAPAITASSPSEQRKDVRSGLLGNRGTSSDSLSSISASQSPRVPGPTQGVALAQSFPRDSPPILRSYGQRRPPPTLRVAEAEIIAIPDEFEEPLCFQKEQSLNHSSGTRRLSDSMCPVVVPTGVPVVQPQEFRRLLVGSRGEHTILGASAAVADALRINKFTSLSQEHVSEVPANALLLSEADSNIQGDGTPLPEEYTVHSSGRGHVPLVRSIRHSYQGRRRLLSPPAIPTEPPYLNESLSDQQYEMKIHSYFACC